MRDAWQAEGLVVAFTNGCFDVIHSGHIHSLETARRQGDRLIVGINSDDSVRRLKGKGRPVFPQGERAQYIAALACVDAVAVFDDDTPIELLRALKPDVHCKGADYGGPDGKPVPEAEVVISYGGRLHFIPLIQGWSTSGIIRRIVDASDV